MENTGKNPLVSTLICTYNAKHFFDATIRSVLDQTYTNQEILIRDDCSTDGTIELLTERAKRDDRIKLFIDPGTKRGPYGGLNYLLDQSKGDYIAIQDHDDIRHSSKLEKQINATKTSKFTCIGVQTIYYFEHLGIAYLNNATVGIVKYTQHSGLLFKKTSERYNTSLKVGNDLDFMIKRLGKIYNISDYLLVHRRSKENNLSTKRYKNKNQMYKLYKEGTISLKSFILYCIRGYFPTTFERISLRYRRKKTRKQDDIFLIFETIPSHLVK